jgi:hypothetical protein
VHGSVAADDHEKLGAVFERLSRKLSELTRLL